MVSFAFLSRMKPSSVAFKPQENGDCESSHGHLKDYLDQQLRLRGSRNFETLDDLRVFIAEKTRKRNAKRSDQLVRDRAALKPLPPSQFPTFTEVDVLVPSTSVIRIKQNAYSIPSHLIDLKLQSRIHADHIALWYQGRKLLEMPRLIGTKQVTFDYRDVIDTLVRKPGGFTNFRYREHMFPTNSFRKGFDTAVAQHGEHAGIKCYLKLLHMAKHHGQNNVEAELRRVLDSGETIDTKAIESKVEPTSPASLVEDPFIEQPELDQYDDLLEHKEVLDEPDKHTDNGAIETATEPRGTGWPFETTEATDDAIHGDRLSGSSIARELESSLIFGCSVDCGDGQASGELVTFRQAWLGKDDVVESVGGRTGALWAYSVLCTMCETRTVPTACQARTTPAADAEEARSIFSVDHRRHRVCTTESRRDGSVVYIDCGSLRANEHVDQQQPTVFEMGADLQGRDDDCGSHRSPSAPQHDHRAQRRQLSIGGSPGKTTSNDYVGTSGEDSSRVEIDQNLVGKFSCR